MNNYVKELSNILISLPRLAKRFIAIVTDMCLCLICAWFALIIRLEEIIPLKDFNFYSVVISIFIAIPIFWMFGLYRTIFRYTEISIIFTILISSFIYGLLYFSVITVYGMPEVPRALGVLQPMLLLFAVICSRLGVKYFFNNNYNLKKSKIKKNVLVYGAGNAGRQLVSSLENSLEFKVVGFLDDDKSIYKQALSGKTIYSPLDLNKLIQTKNIDMIFLAIPSINKVQRSKIIKNLTEHKLKIKTLPSVSEIVDGRITISHLKDLNIEDLLYRNEVQPNFKLLNKNINSQTVLITGAGGSIGSELCKQVVTLKPKKIILIELNEFALYKINEQLLALNTNIKIIPLLINAQDQSMLETVFETFNVDTVYHTAAYKHVPLVEENICEAVKNNVYSTLAVANACVLKKITNFVLISTDKAVRPTNIMGASKRLSELCVQAIYDNFKDVNINFSIVRFGNVLESSGSVIPKFKEQIKKGGPVTLTHLDVTRYFMTVREAAQLVIQAGAMGKNSEVFVLDMGNSIKIIDLIYKMIKLYGLSVKDSKNLNGDIEIETIGLRPGEKLYEELLIGDNPEETDHPKIQKAQDPFIPFDILRKDLEKLSVLLEDKDAAKVKAMLNRIVPTYISDTKMIDHIYKKKFNL